MNKPHFEIQIATTTGSSDGSLTKDDVWGKVDLEQHKKLSEGMIVARGGAEEDVVCPIFKDRLPYKSVTVVCMESEMIEVTYWLEYVHGGESVSKHKKLPGGKMALRSDYQCW